MKTRIGLSVAVMIALTVFSLLDVCLAGLDSVESVLSVSSVEDGKLIGSFSQGTHTIYFEAIRGEKNSSDDVDAPEFAVDIRISNSQNIPFLIRSGAGIVLGADREFVTKKEQNNILSENDLTIWDFYLLPDLLLELEKYSAETDNRTPEMLELIDYLKSINEDDFFNDKALEINLGKRTVPKEQYLYKVEIRKKKLSSFSLGEHSALRVNVYSSTGTLKLSFSSCNGGTCADSPKMSTKCTREWKRNSLVLNVFDDMCNQWSPYGFFIGMHDCHTETKLEYNTVKNGSVSDYYASILCQFPLLFAPSCN